MRSRIFFYWLPSIVLGMALGQFILPTEIANAQSSDQATTEDAQAENPDSVSDDQTNTTADQSNQLDNQDSTSNKPSASNNVQQPAQPSGAAGQQTPPVPQPATQNAPQATTLPAPAGTTNQSPNSSLNQRPADHPANMREPQRDQAGSLQQSPSGNQSLDQQLGIEFEQSQTLQTNPPSAQVNGLSRDGLTIRTIQPQSVFFDSGLRPGDVILSIDNRPILNQSEFSRIVTTYHSQQIPLVIMRGGRQQTIFLTRPQEFAVAQRQPGITSGQAMLGVSMDARIPDAAIVSRVAPASPAERAGLQPGDMIIALNNQPIGSSHQVVQIIASMAPGQQVSLDIARQQSQFQVDAVLAQRRQPVRHSVGYAPQPVPTLERTYAPRFIDEVRPIRPGDADRDGRVLDGDGRLPRRIYRSR
jgi:hypothetical protein